MTSTMATDNRCASSGLRRQASRREARFGLACGHGARFRRRLANPFLKGTNGRRPFYGGTRKFQAGPHRHDAVLFYGCFHGNNGANHQTGRTGVVARLVHLFATSMSQTTLEGRKKAICEAW